MQKKPQLVLLPNVLNDEEQNIQSQFSKAVLDLVPTLDGLIAESEKGGRCYLKRFNFPEGKSFRDIPIKLLSEHTKENEYAELLSSIKQGGVYGLISDAGLPCLADPGAKLVYMARFAGIDIQAHMGPSSIVLALMLSGLGAQKFSFEGYLPKEAEELQAAIKNLQQRSIKEGYTHVFIETPYRALQLYEKLIATLDEKIRLSVCCDLTMPSQYVMTQAVRLWRKAPKPDIQKKLVVFVLSA